MFRNPFSIHPFPACSCCLVFLLWAATATAAEQPLPYCTPFPRQDVRLLDGPFKQAQDTNTAYLMQLDADRLLHTFRINAGLPSQAEPLGGWEEPKGELRGHSTGHYLSALALTYASTGDLRCKERADYLVAELAKCQGALSKNGANPGYLSAFPESFMDRVEAGKPVWAPYYTLHKIAAGLLDVHELCGNAQALDVLRKFAGWVSFRMDRLTVEQQQLTLRTEFGGMQEVLLNLYGITRDPAHLKASRAFDHLAVFDPLARGEDRLDGLHANTQIPKFIAAARDYELTGEARFGKIARFAWDRVANHRSYVIGGHSDHEHFFPTNQFAQHLSPETTETCNTYNMLKLTKHLFEWDRTTLNPGASPLAWSAALMDFYERALFNHILASQDPRTGMYVYLMPLKPGHFKSYSTPLNSFWCCVGTGMENHACYGDAIYSRTADALFVNLFISSKATWKEKGLTITQQTEFPENGVTRLTFNLQKPLKLTVNVRHPKWSEKTTYSVNGENLRVTSQPGTYGVIEREWHDGDVLEARLTMALHTESLLHEPGIISFLYGPIVLSGDLGTDGMEKMNLYIRRQTELSSVPTPSVPVFVNDSGDLLARVHRVKDRPLTFETKALGRPHDIRLVPFYQQHHQRGCVYWPVFTKAEWEKREAARLASEARRREIEARLVDEVFPGQQQSETDHNLRGENMASGPFRDRHWRHASDGGWFGYDLKCQGAEAHVLQITYWGDDAGNRVFDVFVDGKKVATQRLQQNKPGDFFEIEHALPPAAAASTINVKFQAHPGATAGGVFGLRVLRQK